jgi:hypothetical protein
MNRESACCHLIEYVNSPMFGYAETAQVDNTSVRRAKNSGCPRDRFTRSAHKAWKLKSPADAMRHTLVRRIRKCSNV